MYLVTFIAQDILIYNYKQHKIKVIEYSSIVVSTEERKILAMKSQLKI